MSEEVSICIPFYEHINDLIRLLSSIKIQTYKDYEVIIVDDSIKYNINDELKQFSELNIKYYKNKEPLGATRNCNEAMERANGKYIKLMHQDDWFTDESSLEKMVNAINKDNEISLVFTATWQVKDEKRHLNLISDNVVRALRNDYKGLYVGNYIGGPSATIFKNDNCLFDVRYTWLVDVELYMRILKHNGKFIFIKEPIVSIGESNHQLSRNCENNRKMKIKEYLMLFFRYKVFKRTALKKLILVIQNKG